ncbi:ABC transporter ATP-binding protein [Brucella gallinifaecis]|uniref:ABC transporter ATP-binding protein n=1 Tax=Brucella gallinifaecis TaxID=215590 RepID=A0A502BT35_9HYPH|nr:ABC transporter ATP-binding protein [Brucella gallinifaecis]TPF76821.1 ABC transporter ATP-binding protein [Brucella gallinifaecis]
MSEIAVLFENIRKSYGSFEAVRNINFSIKKGELVSLLGPSGCGKTTTLRLIAGLEIPTSGRIMIGGQDVSQVPANKRSIGMVFQSYALFPHLSIRENVAYGLIAQREPKAQAHEKAAAQLEQLDLGHLGDRLPSELSGGQQQRAAVARALVLGPDVLLFDEPLSNLDAKLRRQVREEIRDLQQRLGLTVVYVTHDQAEALAISDRILLMRNGIIEQEGPPRQLYQDPQSEFVADFMGDANVLRLKSGTDGLIKIGDVVLASDVGVNTEMSLLLRPEHIEISAGAGGGLNGRVLRVYYLGSSMEYRIETDYGSVLVVDRHVNNVLSEGTEVSLHIDGSNAKLIPTPGPVPKITAAVA